jgi:hypothetical protein
MEIRQHTLAETDCCGDLFEVWTGAGVSQARVEPAHQRAGRLARLLAPVLSLSAWVLALLG